MNLTVELFKLLGEENKNKIKDGITDIILEQVRTDIEEYGDYFIVPDEIMDFFNECKEEAFKNIREKIVKKYEEEIMKRIDM